MWMQELPVVMNLTREVGIFLARRFEHNLFSAMSIATTTLSRFLLVPSSHW
jgi:hypothetical protein